MVRCRAGREGGCEIALEGKYCGSLGGERCIYRWSRDRDREGGCAARSRVWKPK